MKKKELITIIGFLILFLLPGCKNFLTSPKSSNNSGMWVSAYLGAWNHNAPPGGNWGVIHTDQIDWNAFTQLIYFSTSPGNDGSLSKVAPYKTFSPSRLNAIVNAAHKAKKPILFTVGGWGTHPGFSSSIKAANRTAFVTNLVNFLKKWKFDGIDLDMEPIKSSDVSNYKAFVKKLHASLLSIKTPMLKKPRLIAATKWQPEMYSQLQNDFDEINLMTYDFSGAWPGWVSWYNSPVYDGDLTFPGTTKRLPSANQLIDQFITDGVNRKKLGIGIDFYGYVWMGVAQPKQAWGNNKPTVSANIPYRKIMNDYYNKDKYHWDDTTKAAYLSYEDAHSILSVLPVSQNQLNNYKVFVSYDDKRSIQAKVNYVRKKGIGGLIIWELGGAFFPNNPTGQKDPLLQAVKHDVFKK